MKAVDETLNDIETSWREARIESREAHADRMLSGQYIVHIVPRDAGTPYKEMYATATYRGATGHFDLDLLSLTPGGEDIWDTLGDLAKHTVLNYLKGYFSCGVRYPAGFKDCGYFENYELGYVERVYLIEKRPLPSRPQKS